jgi:heat shock protein HslJ
VPRGRGDCRVTTAERAIVPGHCGRTIRQVLTRLIVVGLSVLAVTACAAAPEPDPDSWRPALPADLAGQAFVSEFAPADASPPLVPGTQVRVSFGGTGHVSVRAGCNAIGGSFLLLDGVLRTGEVSQQIMGCDRARHVQDDWLQSVLESSPRLWVRGEDLRIESSAGWLHLRPEARASSDPIDNTRWRLQAIEPLADPGARPEAVPTVLLEFWDQGRASFDLGCAPGGSSTHTWGGGLSYGRNPDQSIWLRPAPDREARPLCGGESERLAFITLASAGLVGQHESDRLTITGAELKLVFGR